MPLQPLFEVDLFSERVRPVRPSLKGRPVFRDRGPVVALPSVLRPRIRKDCILILMVPRKSIISFFFSFTLIESVEVGGVVSVGDSLT